MPEVKNGKTPVAADAAKPATKDAATKPVVAKAPAGKPVAAKAPARKAAVAKPAAGKATTATATAAKSAAPKLSKLDETKAKNKKALAEALAMARAVEIAQPPKAPAAAAKPSKAKKPKLVRHAFSMPDVEYAQLATLKKRIAALGGNVKRSELVRAGIALLAVLGDVELTAVMAKVERIKTGRPAK